MEKILRDELYKIIEYDSKDSSQYIIAKEIIYRLNLGKPLNSTEIAKDSFSSRPTVVRFAQSFGFEGFREFKKELQRQDAEYDYNFDTKNFDKSFRDYIFLLQEIINEFNHQEQIFIEIVNEIKIKKKIFIFSSLENISLATQFASKLTFLGINAYCAPEKQIFLLNNVDSNDLVLFLASGLENRTLTKTWNYLKDKATKILIATPDTFLKFTNYEFGIKINPLSNLLREQLKNFSFLYVLDQIYNLLVYSDKNLSKGISQDIFWKIN